jgi:hypothetical protein
MFGGTGSVGLRDETGLFEKRPHSFVQRGAFIQSSMTLLSK